MKRTKSGLTVIALALIATVIHAEPVSEVFKVVKDSVVVIRTTETGVPQMMGGQPTSVGGLGSGVLIDSLGVVLTAAHVVQVAEQIEVEFTSGEVIPARVESSVPSADLAVLRLKRPPKGGVSAILADSDRTEVGDQIFIVGAPLGISHTLTVGHISARRKSGSLHGGLFSGEMFQTDAAINVGNSGGPMFNMSGEVVGIVSHMISQSGGYGGLGFVMTSNLARDLLLRQDSFWTGLEGYLLTGPLARAFNLPQDAGILVQRVAKGSPASRIGLRPGTIHVEIEGESIVVGGDVVLEYEGISFAEPDGMSRIMELKNSLSPGVQIEITILRQGKRMTLAVVPKLR